MKYIYGKNVCREIIINNSNMIAEVWITNDNEILNLLQKNKIKYQIASKEFLNNLVNTSKHQGIVLLVKTYKYTDLDQIIENTKNQKNPLILVLDQIEDPHNFGAILRTCWATNVDAVVILARRQVSLNATVAKTSAGAIYQVPVVQVKNLNRALDKLKAAGFWIVGTTLETNKMYDEIKYNFPTVLIVGNEGKGISYLLQKNSDYLVKIPMYSNAQSLNVSVATAVMLYQIRLSQK